MVQTLDGLPNSEERDPGQKGEQKLIGGTYKIIRHINSGGMGSIFYGEHVLTGQAVAIKMLHPDFSADPTLRSRFFEEAKALANLTHPNIVELKNFIEEDGKLYLIMQYIEGETVSEMLEKKKKLSLEESLPIILQVLEGLNYIHGKNIIHRDIKPSNIMLNKEGIVKLADFGIAKNRSKPGLTATGMTVGTFHYMSPEQIVGSELDARSDIYSLGITFFEMVTGQLPFDAPTEYSICQKHLMEKLPSVKKFDPSLPSSLDKILKKATAKDPKKRFQSALEFSQTLLDEFGHLLKKYPFTYMQPILVSSTPKPRSCIGMLTIAVATVFFISFFGYLTYSFFYENTRFNQTIQQWVEKAKHNLGPLWKKVVKDKKSENKKPDQIKTNKKELKTSSDTAQEETLINVPILPQIQEELLPPTTSPSTTEKMMNGE